MRFVLALTVVVGAMVWFGSWILGWICFADASRRLARDEGVVIPGWQQMAGHGLQAARWLGKLATLGGAGTVGLLYGSGWLVKALGLGFVIWAVVVAAGMAMALATILQEMWRSHRA